METHAPPTPARDAGATADDLPRFLRACRGLPTDRPPVWVMRQAGRYLPEYRAIRAELDFLTLCRTPDKVAEVTVQPIDRLGVDAAILFADILLIPDAMGGELSFVKGDGPKFARPVRDAGDLSGLRTVDVDRDLGYVFDAVAACRAALADRRGDDGLPIPLIGFAGTPWTVAAYLVEGGPSKDYRNLLAWSYRDPAGLHQLLERIADVTIDYLAGQIAAGVQAVQLFDTWAGLLDASRYRDLVMPSMRRILDSLPAGLPRIVFARNTAHLLPTLATLPDDVALSIDWRTPLAEARAVVGPTRVLQGNLDPAALLGPLPTIEIAARRLVEEGRQGVAPGRSAHIANLGHGILHTTQPEQAEAFVAAIRAAARVDAAT
ncbi:MAG: uroporphyrinogen decarboxylase [Acidobacteriota bacterium]